VRRSPRIIRRAAAPVSLGLQVARVAVWASALTLTASAVKDWCYQAADRAVSDIETHMKTFNEEEEDNEEDEEGDEEFLEADEGGGGYGTPEGQSPRLAGGDDLGESFANTH
jgi:hypothetical protein